MTNSKPTTLLRPVLALFAGALAAIPTAAYAGDLEWKRAKEIYGDSRILPPLEYDYQFRGQLIVVRKPADLMEKICPKTILPTTLACAVRFNEGKACVVIIGDDTLIAKGPWPYDIVLRHEVGHCNGWPGNHPNGRRYENGYEPRPIPIEAAKPRLMPLQDDDDTPLHLRPLEWHHWPPGFPDYQEFRARGRSAKRREQ